MVRLFLLSFMLWVLCCTASVAQVVVKMETGSGLTANHNAEIIMIRKQLQEGLSYAEAIVLVGEKLQKAGKFETAIYWYQFLLPEVLFDRETKRELFNNIAVCYEKTGDYEQSLQYYLKALALVPPVDYGQKYKATVLTNISSTLIYIKDYEKALFYIKQAIDIFTKNRDTLKSSIAMATKARIYTETGNYHQALQTYKYAFHNLEPLLKAGQNEQIRAINLASGILNNVADVYLKEGHLDSASYYLDSITPHMEKLSLYIQAAISVSRGEMFSKKNQYREASYHMSKGLKLATGDNVKDITMQAHKSLSDLYGKQGLFEKAWQHEKMFVATQQSMLAIEKLHQISKLEHKYDLALKDAEIVRNQLKIKQQESNIQTTNLQGYILAIGLLSAIAIIFTLYRNYQNKQKLFRQKLSNMEQARKIMVIEATLKGEEKERSRIAKELHDGIASEVLVMKLNLKKVKTDFPGLHKSGTYNNIICQSEEIARNLRRMAHNLMPKDVGEMGICAYIKAFLQRIDNADIRFTFQCYGDIPPLAEHVEKVVVLSVLELIQNILKHSKATEALIQLHYFEEILSITVEDNGVGFLRKESLSEGMGLSSLKEHMENLSAHLDIKSTEYSGTTIFMEIPVAGATTIVKS